MLRTWPLFWLVLSFSACGDNLRDAFPDLEAGCQPLLAGEDCTLPFPSDFYRVEDPSMPSGHRVHVTGAAALRTEDDELAEISDHYALDGFSRLPLIVAVLPDPEGVSPEGLVGALDDYGESLGEGSSTLLVDAETGERIAHFVDVDPRAFDISKRAIAIHPMVPLRENTRYVVALRGLRTDVGTVAKSPVGFARLRDGQTRGIPELEGLADHFEAAIFPILEAQGVERSELQLAWDFTTGSDEQALGDMWRVRELTRAWLEANPPAVEITRVEEDVETEIWRRIEGTITVPLFLDSLEPGARLVRDAEGRVAAAGLATVPFLLHVPVSVRDTATPTSFLCFGHGFFGDRRELDGQLTRTITKELAVAMIAIDWWGMARDDMSAVIVDLTSNPSQSVRFADRVHQSMANWMVLTEALPELAAQDALQRPQDGPGSGDGTAAGQPIVDATRDLSFLGISQGHILGGVLAAVHPDLKRIVLNVGGAGLTHLMFRAKPFSPFLEFASRNFKRPIAQYRWAAELQRVFDAIEPGMYARYVFQAPLADASPRQVLMQVGVADTSMPNYGSYFHARALHLPAVSNAPIGLFAIDDVAQSQDNGLSVFDYGISDEFYIEPVAPLDYTPVHDDVRITPSALQQMREFLAPEGRVEATCDGSCDPN